MPNLAFVICKKANGKAAVKANPFRRAFHWVSVITGRLRPDILVKGIRLYDERSLIVVKLPYSIEELKGMVRNKANCFIDRVCTDFSIREPIIPLEIRDALGRGNSEPCGYGGKVLFKSLLVDILEEICSARSIKISDIDIVLASEAICPELYTYLSLLSPLVKYVTIITRDRNAVEEDINRIFEDTGLSIGVTTDFKSGLRNGDIIINLCGLRECANLRLKNGAVLINLEGMKIKGVTGQNTVINGVEISLPHKLVHEIGRETLDFFSTEEIAEAILSAESEGWADSGGAGFVKGISQSFRRMGCRITGFLGQYNRIRISDIGARNARS